MYIMRKLKNIPELLQSLILLQGFCVLPVKLNQSGISLAAFSDYMGSGLNQFEQVKTHDPN